MFVVVYYGIAEKHRICGIFLYRVFQIYYKSLTKCLNNRHLFLRRRYYDVIEGFFDLHYFIEDYLNTVLLVIEGIKLGSALDGVRRSNVFWTTLRTCSTIGTSYHNKI